MTGSIGGRTAKVTRAAVPARPPERRPAAQIGDGCFCGKGPTDPANQTASGSSLLDHVETCTGQYTGDNRVEVTVNTWDANANDLTLGARVNLAGPNTGYGYNLYIVGLAPSSWANASWEIRGGNPDANIAGPTTIPRPAPGDVIEFSAIGTAIVAKLNGGTVLSATSSAISAAAQNQLIVSGNAAGNIDIDVVYQDYC